MSNHFYIAPIAKNHFAYFGNAFAFFKQRIEKEIDGHVYHRDVEKALGVVCDKEYYDNIYKTVEVIFDDEKEEIVPYVESKQQDTFVLPKTDWYAQIRLRPNTHEYNWLKLLGIDLIKFSAPKAEEGYLFEQRHSENEYINTGLNLINKYYSRTLKRFKARIDHYREDILYSKSDKVIIQLEKYGYGNIVALEIPLVQFMQLKISTEGYEINWSNINIGSCKISKLCNRPENISIEKRLEIVSCVIKQHRR